MGELGNYYVIAKPELREELKHYRIDHLKDIMILERNVDMIFGGINPSQYAERFIFQRGEFIERYDLECDRKLWQQLVERFGSNITALREEPKKIAVKIKCIPSEMKEWVLAHLNQCEVIAPKNFRDEIQKEVMGAFKKYCG